MNGGMTSNDEGMMYKSKQSMVDALLSSFIFHVPVHSPVANDASVMPHTVSRSN